MANVSARTVIGFLSVLIFASPSIADELQGRVLDLNGRPISKASVIFEQGAGAPGPSTITVFTGDDGGYRFPDDAALSLATGTLRVRALGYRQVSPAPASRAPDSPAGADLIVEPAPNIAATAPASAWLAAIPESDAKHLTLLQCTGCHQFPTPKMRRFAASLEAVPGADRIEPAERAEWRQMVRREGWRAMVQYMRAKSYVIFPDGTNIDIRDIPWSTVQDPRYGLFNARDEQVIPKFLGRHLPRQFEHMSGYRYGAPVGVNRRTVIREYQLPDTSLVREVTVSKNSPYIWGADLQKNRLMRLDPVSGEVKWIPVPFDGPTGPHTILTDPEGNIWVSMLESDILARFDGATEQWKLWKLDPTGKDVFGGQAMVHDIAFDANYNVAFDGNGRVWMTLIGSNKMASLDPQTGEVRHYPAPTVDGRSGVNMSLYGVVLSSDGKCAWFSQLAGYVGCFNTETLEYESLLRFPEGAGPRRLAVDENDILWVPLFGSGQILKYDGRTRQRLGLYDLPDRAAAPYSVTWDPRRKVLWVANSNSDAIYRFDPATETFSVIPLPRTKGLLRKIALHPKTGDLITSYGNIPTGSGPSMVLIIDPGDLGDGSR